MKSKTKPIENMVKMREEEHKKKSEKKEATRSQGQRRGKHIFSTPGAPSFSNINVTHLHLLQKIRFEGWFGLN
jgi:hypothetical protein